jgi:hypothetical protein
VRALTILDRTRTRKYLPEPGVIDAIAAALQIQIERDFAPIWGIEPPAVTVEGRGEPIYIFDSDASGDYGVTTTGRAGRPFAHVYAKPSFDHESGWLTGRDSISSSISHEALEMLADPSVNTFHYNAARLMWGHDVCDPVQEVGYGIRAGGRLVPISDFVRPAYFNPYGAPPPYDFCKQVTEPFEILPGGYATVERARAQHTRERHRIAVRFNKVPKWRREQKLFGEGRTAWRGLIANTPRRRRAPT